MTPVPIQDLFNRERDPYSGILRAESIPRPAHKWLYFPSLSNQPYINSPGGVNYVFVTLCYVVRCLENKMKRMSYKATVVDAPPHPSTATSVRWKYIHLIEALCPNAPLPPLSHHSLISHTTRPCHNLDSSLPSITPFCNLVFPLSPPLARRGAARPPQLPWGYDRCPRLMRAEFQRSTGWVHLRTGVMQSDMLLCQAQSHRGDIHSAQRRWVR